MGRSGIFLRSIAAPLGAALALASAAPGLAQSAGDYRDFRLPAKPTSAPPVVGPTDPEVPAPRTPAPTAAPAPTSTQGPAPAIVVPVPSPTATRAPTPQTPRQGVAPTAQPGPAGSPQISATPSAAPTNGAGSPFPSPPVAATAFAPDTALPGAPAPIAAEDKSGTPWWLWPLLAAAAAMAAGLGWLAYRRNTGGRAAAPPEFVRPRVPVAAADAAPVNAAPVPAPATEPVAAARSILNLKLDATRMSATLINATLSYRLSVSNNGSLPVSDIAVSGDMISAHSSVPSEQMLGGDASPMPALHRIASLAPGESVTVSGDIRLPLAAITPILRGAAKLFVPLARFRTAGTAAGIEVIEHGAFLVGQEPEARAKLQPFRLDLGPRLYSQVGQRPIVVAA